MANDLATIEPLKLPDRRNPALMPSLPAWLGLRIAALESVHQPDRAGKHRQVATLPERLLLGSSEREAVERHIADLSQFLDVSQPCTIRDRVLTNDQAHAVIIAALLMKPGARKDGAVIETMTENYLDAIEDLPAWAVREAVRKWNRGESQQLDKKPHDFTWAPAEATLRRLSLIELWTVKGRVLALQKLVNAERLIEYSEEHRGKMLADLSTVLHDIVDKNTTARANHEVADEVRMRTARKIGSEADRLAEQQAAE